MEDNTSLHYNSLEPKSTFWISLIIIETMAALAVLIIDSMINLDPVFKQILVVITLGVATYTWRHEIMFLRQKEKYNPTFIARKHGITVPTAFQIITVICVLSTTSQIIMRFITHIKEDANHNEAITAISNSPAWAVMLLVCIIAPVCEELIFRGWLHPLLRTRLPRFATIIITSLVFAALHGNITQSVTAFILGCGLSYLYEKTGRVSIGIITHALANMLGIIASSLMTFAGIT